VKLQTLICIVVTLVHGKRNDFGTGWTFPLGAFKVLRNYYEEGEVNINSSNSNNNNNNNKLQLRPGHEGLEVD